MKIKDLLKNKGPEVFTVGIDKSLKDAIAILVANNIGSLLVINADGKIEGILTERDILRQSAKDPHSFGEISVRESMTSNIIFIEDEDTLEYASSIISNNKIRHLPVLNKNKVLVGLISIGDINTSHVKMVKAENKYLRDYIEGNVK
jgi:CBS domain-containing protein